jgi:hypothetical protein
MKTFLKTIAWVGAGFLSIVTILSFKLSWDLSHYILESQPVAHDNIGFLSHHMIIDFGGDI